MSFAQYNCAVTQLHIKNSMSASLAFFFFFLNFFLLKARCVHAYLLFLVLISMYPLPSFQHAPHAITSLTRTAPSVFVSAELLGGRENDGFKVNLHHHRK